MAIYEKGNLGLQETVGSQVTFNEDGIASATVEYIAKHDEAVSAASRMESHPEFSFLKRKSIRVTMEEGGMARISATFEGVPPQTSGGGGGVGGGVSAPKYTIRLSTSSEPIERHINFDYYTNPAQTGAEFEMVGGKRGAFIGFTKRDNATQKLFYQVKNYFSPGVIFQETVLYERASSSTSAVKAELSKIGLVDNPPNVGNFINVPQNRNWLLIGADAEQVGYGYKVTRQWKLSTPGGWNPFIYGTGAPTSS